MLSLIMLVSLLLIPVIGSLILFLIPETTEYNIKIIKNLGLFTSLLTFFISILLYVLFDPNTAEYQFVTEFTNLNFCHLYIGIDGLSLVYVLLTTIITPIALLSNYTDFAVKHLSIKYFIISFLVLETLQLSLFVVLDLFLFYIFFESVLPVLFIIILIYGSGQMKERSAFLFFLYTLAGSLLMLLSILYIFNNLGSTDFALINLNEMELGEQKLLWIGFFVAFAVKTPLFPVHIWLPKAHSDAPLAASILLAGTILKFATYGFIRVLINFLPDATHYFSPVVQTIAIITLIYASLTTIVQNDTKELIAYSSICHMAVVVLGIFSNSIQGIEGAILLSLAHGFSSGALFLAVGGVLYVRFHTRNLNYLRGLVNVMPVFTILFFIFILANSGIPLTLNWIGEQLALIGVWQMSPLVAILGGSGILFSAIYSIYLFNRISYGSFSPYLNPMIDLTRREFNLFITLFIFTVGLGFYPNIILNILHMSITTLLSL